MNKTLVALLLALPLFFAACSSDDKDDNGNGNLTNINLKGKAIAYNKVELEWNTLKDAYSYQVFFKAEGQKDWKETNARMATANDGATIKWDGGEFTYFNGGVKYDIKVKAFRDSREGSVMGESNTIAVQTPDETENLIVGKWLRTKERPVRIETNNAELSKFIESFFTKDLAEKNENPVEFKADKTFKSEYTVGDKKYEDSGIYEIKGNQLIMTTKIIENEETEDVETYGFEVSKTELNLTSDFNPEEYDWFIEQFQKEKPVDGLKITKITFVTSLKRL